MPRLGDYTNCKIYKIISYSHPELVYYGHTCQTLSQRMGTHRSKNNRSSCKQIIEKGDAIILLVLNYPCDDKEQARAKEAEYIINNTCVNKNMPGRTGKAYYEANADKIKEKKKLYYEINTDKLKLYREANKDDIKEKQKLYYEANKDKLKAYQEANIEKIKAYQKAYHKANIDIIKEKNKLYYEARKNSI